MVSLGPIHHGTPKYQPAEEYKLRMANNFVEDSGKKNEILYDTVEKNIEQLRQCFNDEVTDKYDDQALAWMLFVDGCAILQSIYCAVHGKCKDLKIKNDHMAFGKQDLFLLENQLPYQLLVDLMNSSAKKNELRDSVKSFISMALHNIGSGAQDGGTTETPVHLLDLLRTRLLCKRGSPGLNAGEKNNSDDRNENGGVNVLQSTYRNVQELRAAGIYVKPGKPGSLTAISFTKRLNIYPGYLRLSPIIVDDSTGPNFLNLIAYEMCPDFYNDFEVTSYISFLDSLIDHANDVKELRKAGILHNLLGSDKEVAKLFNEIGTDLVPDPKAYGIVKEEIQNHYNTEWKTWISEAIHDHFSSPWTFLALFAAILVLGLTLVQT